MYICRLQQSSSAFTPSLRPIVPWERDMEKRKSHSRFMSSRFRMTGGGRPGNATAVILGQSSSPSSGGESSPLRRKSISITPYHNTADELSPTNDYQTASPCQLSSPLQQDFSVIVTSSRSPARRKPLSRKLRKQRSADELQIRGLWPSTKKPGASAIKSTLEDHLKDEDRLSDMVESYNKVEDLRPTVAHAATTFSFRQRTSSESCRIEDSGSNKLRRSKQNRPLGGSMRHQKENFRIEGSLKKPGTPPSPSSSSSSANGPPPTARILSGRLSVDEKVLARRRSEFGLEFASTESERSEIKIPSPRISRAPVKIAIRRPGSPVRRSRSPVVRSSNSPVLRRSGSPVRRSGSPARRSGSPARLSASPVAADLGGKAVPGRCRPSPVKGGSGGMGSFISLGLGNLFRRKSFSSTTMPSPQPPSTIETVVTGSPVKGKAVTLAVGWQARGTASTIGSPARGAATTIGSPARGAATTIGSPARGAAAAVGSPSRAVAVAVDLQHKSKMVHNHLIQWRFLNACRAMVSKLNWTAAERNLMSAWLGLSDLQLSVAQKRLQLDKHKLCFKLSALLPSQKNGGASRDSTW
ncbi:hypothetical protein AXF42_Ash011045 [Apostasia shenzhenica]|uniref:Uncharacterized protein n=1 Tax=Apostasia shenzhenica TaxID=1088818 RepID=A0A2H9ZQY3_9ASPA|nr:hypothetical protein AXF42_Ash011045 [Apostasia shenzhenica]